MTFEEIENKFNELKQLKLTHKINIKHYNRGLIDLMNLLEQKHNIPVLGGSQEVKESKEFELYIQISNART